MLSVGRPLPASASLVRPKPEVRVVHGRHFTLLLVAALAFSTITDASLQVPSAAPQTFRAGTDLLLLDVTVLDRQRQPVHGLSPSDFTVLVDGRERPVTAFKVIDAPAVAVTLSEAAPWVRDIATDVATNRNPPGRLVAVIIDDYSMAEARLGPGQIEEARRTALSIVEMLGPDDRAAVLFSGNRHTTQTFTSDRSLLRAAIERAAITPAPADIVEGIGPGDQGFCDCGVCSMRTLEEVSRILRTVPELRKTAFYISAGSVVSVPRSLTAALAVEVQPGLLRKEHCAWERLRAMDAAMRQVQLANLTIEAFDPTGLTLGGHGTPDTTPKLEARPSGAEANPQYPALEDPATLRVESLRAMAEATGGRAIVNNNDAHLEVPAVLAESGSYYLIGVAPPPPEAEGRFHPVEVRVNQAGVEIRTRKGYYDPTMAERAAEAALASAGGLSAVGGPFAAAAFPLEVTASPVATPDGRAALALSIDIWPPSDSVRPLPYTEIVDITSALFNPETGVMAASSEQRLNLTWERPNARFGFFELVSRLPTPPGRYELRVGVATTDGRRASVYSSVDVPNFKEGFALSGLMLNAVPAPAGARTDDVMELLPARPTARRTFRDTDEVMAFLRIYQDADRGAQVTVMTTVTAASGAVVASDALDVAGERVGSLSEARYEVALPLATLGAGEYLLSVDVTAGERRGRRQLRFAVE